MAEQHVHTQSWLIIFTRTISVGFLQLQNTSHCDDFLDYNEAHDSDIDLVLLIMSCNLRIYTPLLDRLESNTKQVCEERSESCSGADDTLPLTKHVDSSEDNVDKACLSDSRIVPVSADTEFQLAEDGVEIHSIGDAEWAEFRSTDARIADVREISPEAEGSSLDIPVVSPTVDSH